MMKTDSVILPIMYYIEIKDRSVSFDGVPKAQICMNNVKGKLMRITTFLSCDGLRFIIVPLTNNYIIMDETKKENVDYYISENIKQTASSINKLLT